MAHDLNDVVDALRPDAELELDWSARQLHLILATRPRRRARALKIGVGAAVGVAVLSGGAYAGGLIPTAVTERLGQSTDIGPLGQIGDVREVFDLTTRDGTRVQMFAADNRAGGQCWTVTHDLSSGTDPEDLGYGCVAGGVTAGPANAVGVVPTDSEHNGPQILFGSDLDGAAMPAGTVDVQVTAEGFTRTVSVDDQGRWAVEMPRIMTKPTRVLVVFLDVNDQPLGRTSEAITP
jgi:hypothetical protein